MSNANTLFGDDWQPADWLSAIERLAVTPPLEGIPASSKILDAATKPPTWGWPMPRTFGDDTPDAQEIILVWHGQRWNPAYVSFDQSCFYFLGDREEAAYLLDSDVLWLPLPHAIEVQA